MTNPTESDIASTESKQLKAFGGRWSTVYGPSPHGWFGIPLTNAETNIKLNCSLWSKNYTYLKSLYIFPQFIALKIMFSKFIFIENTIYAFSKPTHE